VAFQCPEPSDTHIAITSYLGDGSYYDLLLSALKARSDDVTHLLKGGTYYLFIDSTCQWHVIVRSVSPARR
jgi:hypothetical protein